MNSFVQGQRLCCSDKSGREQQWLKGGLSQRAVTHMPYCAGRDSLCTEIPLIIFMVSSRPDWATMCRKMSFRSWVSHSYVTTGNIRAGLAALSLRNSLEVKVITKSNTVGPGKPGIFEYLMCSVKQGDHPPVRCTVVHSPPEICFEAENNLLTVCDYILLTAVAK